MTEFAPTFQSTKVYSSIYFKTPLSSVQITEQFKLKFLSSQSVRLSTKTLFLIKI